MSGFADRLTGEVTTLALCWRIVRADGVALGFTTHDRDLVVAGLRHASAPGMLPSAISSGDGLEVDTMEVAGALSAGSITGQGGSSCSSCCLSWWRRGPGWNCAKAATSASPPATSASPTL